MADGKSNNNQNVNPDMERSKLEQGRLDIESDRLSKERWITVFKIVILGAALLGAYDLTDRYLSLEKQKLDLMEQQFDVQKEQTNRFLDIQQSEVSSKGLEMILNSPVLETSISDLINSPKGAAKGLADLAETLISINKVNWNIGIDLPLDSAPSNSSGNLPKGNAS
jgi:hypothetical protein